MDIGGQPVPVDLRMPGYPAFLAILYALTGRSGEYARLFVMLAQVLVDLASCVLIGLLAGALVLWCSDRCNAKRAFSAGLWCAVLCPLTANYVAVPLTEIWAIFFTALSFLLLVILTLRITRSEVPPLITRSIFTRSIWTISDPDWTCDRVWYAGSPRNAAHPCYLMSFTRSLDVATWRNQTVARYLPAN